MNKSQIKKIINANNLTNVDNLIGFIKKQSSNYDLNDLKELAEFSNANRNSNSAFYTNNFIVKQMMEDIPMIDSDEISILEPSSGIGNFIIPFIKKMSKLYKKVNVDINDIDPDSLRVLKVFISFSSIPDNVQINYYSYDFLSGMAFNDCKYDYIIGNPPFQRVSSRQASDDGYPGVTNLAGQFLVKSMQISKIVSMIMPKNMLSTSDFNEVRQFAARNSIKSIRDFGENGFKGVLIETIGITMSLIDKPKSTKVSSMITNESNVVSQNYITDNKYPTWLIYRNSFFDDIASKMKFNCFNVFRDRQITNKKLSENGKVRVIKSRNIARDGSGIIDIPGYDKYYIGENMNKLSVYRFFNDNNVYLVPNMTYYPRIVRKDESFIVNGSVAVLIPKNNKLLTDKQIKFINSSEFSNFYKIARNRSTRSLNIDNTSVFWFGKYVGERSNDK